MFRELNYKSILWIGQKKKKNQKAIAIFWFSVKIYSLANVYPPSHIHIICMVGSAPLWSLSLPTQQRLCLVGQAVMMWPMCSLKLVPCWGHPGMGWMGFISPRHTHLLMGHQELPESGGGLWLNLPLKGAPRALTTPPKYAPMGVAGPDPAAQWREGFVPVRVANADHSLWGTLCIERCWAWRHWWVLNLQFLVCWPY